MKPACYNRPPFPTTVEVNDGLSPDGRQLRKTIPFVFVDRCATWDGRGIGPNGEPYPVAHGFECGGCKWLPSGITLPVNYGPTEVPQHER